MEKYIIEGHLRRAESQITHINQLKDTIEWYIWYDEEEYNTPKFRITIEEID